MPIFQVRSNLNHNGEPKKAGSFFEGALESFTHLVKDGVLCVIEGATSLEHAAQIVADEVAKAAEKATDDVAVEPQNTWGPQPDKPEESKTPVVPPAPSEDLPKPPAPTVNEQSSNVPPAPVIDPAGDNL